MQGSDLDRGAKAAQRRKGSGARLSFVLVGLQTVMTAIGYRQGCFCRQ